jgi:glycosyltransferase involved in cell wall biosynthesis
VEVFCKAADALVLPYTHVFQSGVLFVGYSFGLPVLATDVGSLREEIIEGETGLVCEPENAASLAKAIRDWLENSLYHERAARQAAIQAYANERYAWSTVSRLTKSVYDAVLR